MYHETNKRKRAWEVTSTFKESQYQNITHGPSFPRFWIGVGMLEKDIIGKLGRNLSMASISNNHSNVKFLNYDNCTWLCKRIVLDSQDTYTKQIGVPDS
jgi:hypothetical protein